MNESTETTEPAEIHRRSARAVVTLTGRAAALLLLSFVANVALVRLLTPEDFGLMALAGAVSGIAAVVADGGLGAGLIRPETPPDNRTLGSALGFQILTMGTVTLAVVIAAIVVGGEVLGIAAVVALTLPIVALRLPAIVQLERVLRYGPIGRVDLAGAVLYYCVAIPLALSRRGRVVAGVGALGRELFVTIALLRACAIGPRDAEVGVVTGQASSALWNPFPGRGACPSTARSGCGRLDRGLWQPDRAGVFEHHYETALASDGRRSAALARRVCKLCTACPDHRGIMDDCSSGVSSPSSMPSASLLLRSVPVRNRSSRWYSGHSGRRLQVPFRGLPSASISMQCRRSLALSTCSPSGRSENGPDFGGRSGRGYDARDRRIRPSIRGRRGRAFDSREWSSSSDHPRDRYPSDVRSATASADLRAEGAVVAVAVFGVAAAGIGFGNELIDVVVTGSAGAAIFIAGTLVTKPAAVTLPFGLARRFWAERYAV